MTAPFTPEQEARIAEIVEALLAGCSRHAHQVAQADLETGMAWARHWAGIPPRQEADDA